MCGRHGKGGKGEKRARKVSEHEREGTQEAEKLDTFHSLEVKRLKDTFSQTIVLSPSFALLLR